MELNSARVLQIAPFGAPKRTRTRFESWWVHRMIVDGGSTIHNCGLYKDLQQSPTKVGLFVFVAGQLITGFCRSVVKV